MNPEQLQYMDQRKADVLAEGGPRRLRMAIVAEALMNAFVASGTVLNEDEQLWHAELVLTALYELTTPAIARHEWEAAFNHVMASHDGMAMLED